MLSSFLFHSGYVCIAQAKTNQKHVPSEKTMSSDVNDISISYEEDGQLLVKELDKEILTKGAWATIIFRYQNWSKAKNEFGKEMFTIRRYQKRDGDYLPKSKFNISSVEQAQKIITTLEKWVK